MFIQIENKQVSLMQNAKFSSCLLFPLTTTVATSSCSFRSHHSFLPELQAAYIFVVYFEAQIAPHHIFKNRPYV